MDTNTKTLSRRTDPLSSHVAAEESGPHRAWHTQVIAEAIDREPGLTAKQLAERTSLDNVQVCRRSGDLKKLGYEARIVSGQREQCWFPAATKEQGRLF